MAYTFTLQDTPFAKDATFDSLYADSIEDFDSGTVVFGTGATDEYKIYRVYNMITQTGYGDDKFISISKDSATIMQIQGYIKKAKGSKKFYWMGRRDSFKGSMRYQDWLISLKKDK